MGASSWQSISKLINCQRPPGEAIYSALLQSDVTLLIKQATYVHARRKRNMSPEIFFQELYKHRDCLTKSKSVRDGLGDMVFPQLSKWKDISAVAVGR